jgi:hypothetical protein
MTNERYRFLETDHTDDEIASFNERFCADPCADELLTSLRRRGMDDREIVIAFRLIARIPREWEIEREPEGKAAKRRATLAAKLRKLAAEVENDPDLSGLCFSANTISFGTPNEDREGLISLADCIKEGLAELELQLPLIKAVAGNKPDDQKHTPDRTIALKKFAIRETFTFISKTEKRALNKETAMLTSILLSENVTANDVTQARKSERRKYYRD